MPVASMSMRLRIGGIQTFDSPGTFTTRSSSSTSFSGVMPARHWSRGLNWIVVSNISSGAGSVAVSARPALPNTLATSGTVRIRRSVICRSSAALPVEMPGQRGGHVQEVAFVHRRDEFAAQPRERKRRARDHDERQRRSSPSGSAAPHRKTGR